jgi:hypothetical protein
MLTLYLTTLTPEPTCCTKAVCRGRCADRYARKADVTLPNIRRSLQVRRRAVHASIHHSKAQQSPILRTPVYHATDIALSSTPATERGVRKEATRCSVFVRRVDEGAL